MSYYQWEDADQMTHLRLKGRILDINQQATEAVPVNDIFALFVSGLRLMNGHPVVAFQVCTTRLWCIESPTARAQLQNIGWQMTELLFNAKDYSGPAPFTISAADNNNYGICKVPTSAIMRSNGKPHPGHFAFEFFKFLTSRNAVGFIIS